MVLGLTLERPKSIMEYPKFVVKKTSDGRYTYNLYSQENGKIIARGEPYNTKKACLHCIIAVIQEAPSAAIEAIIN